MRKIFLLAVCTLLVLPSQWDSSSALANDSCLSLNTTQYLEASSRLIPLDSNFTIEFDFYLSKDNKSHAEVISQGGQPNSFYIGINPDLGIRAGDTWADTGAKMPLQKWVHIALTRTSASVGTFYIDGKVFATINNYVLNNVGTATRVGAQYDTGASERITGCIDNLMIWKSVRTPNEVVQDSLVKSPITNANLIAFYGFDSVSSTGLIEDNAVPSNSLRPLNTPELFPVTDPSPNYSIEYKSGDALRGSNGIEGGSSYYVAADLKNPFPDDFGSGFGWYSTAWAISPSQIDNFQLGLSSTWITPNDKTVSATTAQKLCETSTNSFVKNLASDPNSGTYGLNLFQTIEGSLGWWGGQKFRTVLPKYMANVTQNCYTTELATPGWGFFTGEPISRANTGLIQISNQILMPPDGMTFAEDDSGPQLGITWHALNLPRFDHAFGSTAGENSWTLFMNSYNFKGPIAFVAPQFWVDGSISNPLQKGLTLDKRPGISGGLASEWAGIPYYKYTDSTGKIYTKIPQLQFPVDSNGDFAISRDFKSYSSKAISSDFKSALAGSASLPRVPASQEVASGVLIGSSPRVFQDGKTLADVATTLTAKGFDNGNAYGFSAPGKSGMIKLPQYFLESATMKNEISELQVPRALAKSTFSNPSAKSTFVYQYPSWWDASPKASEDFTTQLTDGSVVVYRWYKFVDQPALQRFELNETEKNNLQSAVIKMQRDWANSPMMANPSKGNLVSFESGLLTSTPNGLEFGYVPIVIKQYMGTGPRVVTPTPTPTPKVIVTAAPLANKTTITCIKGKLVKKVTAIKPVCPKGYKIKY